MDNTHEQMHNLNVISPEIQHVDTNGNATPQDRGKEAQARTDGNRKRRRPLQINSLLASLRAELESDDWDSVLGDAKRQRVHDFFLVPSRFESFAMYGCGICIDALLYNFTILPARVAATVGSLATGGRRLKPAQIVDLLKFALVFSTVSLLDLLDSSVVYHTVRGQAVLKLYVIFNVLEICDRLCCAFGHDILDSLFDGVASSPKAPRWIHFVVAAVYCYIHALILVSLSTTLQVAILSHSSSLLTLLLSNQFVEIKGSVFKRYETENLFQLSCSDVVERVQLAIFLIGVGWRNWAELSEGGVVDEEPIVASPAVWTTFVAMLRSVDWIRVFTDFRVTLKLLFSAVNAVAGIMLGGLGWLLRALTSLIPSLEVLPPLLYPLGLVYGSEILVDWLKHSFIVKFNKLSPDVYYQFGDSLSREIVEGRNSHHGNTKQTNSSDIDHSPLVAKRLGFVSLPLTCFLLRLGGQMLRLAGAHWTIQSVVLGICLYAVLLVVKLVLGDVILSYSVSRYKAATGPSVLDAVQHNIFPAPLPKIKKPKAERPTTATTPPSTSADSTDKFVELLPSRFEFAGSRIV